MKKLFTLFVASMAVVSLSAKTVYLNTASSSWAQDEAVTFIHAWGGSEAITNVRMEPVEEGSLILSADCGDNTSIVFVRMPAGSEVIEWDEEGKKYWNKTEDQEIPGDKNQFSVIDWSGEIAYGIWGTFGVLPTVAIVGDFGENMWNPNNTNTMTPANDNATAAVTLALTEGTYEFKVWVDGYYFSLNGEGESLYGIHREWKTAEHVNLVNSGRNFSLAVDETGDYTFTWNYTTLDMTVDFPNTTPTVVVNADSAAKVVKRIVNGQLVIEKNGVRYNALGAEIR